MTSRNRRQQQDRKTSFRELARSQLLEDYAPACVLVNRMGEILYVHGRTGKFLEQATGEPN